MAWKRGGSWGQHIPYYLPIKVFKVYNGKRIRVYYCFPYFWMFSSVSKKAHSCKVPPFDVPHHILQITFDLFDIDVILITVFLRCELTQVCWGYNWKAVLKYNLRGEGFQISQIFPCCFSFYLLLLHSFLCSVFVLLLLFCPIVGQWITYSMGPSCKFFTHSFGFRMIGYGVTLCFALCCYIIPVAVSFYYIQYCVLPLN